ncbi:MAG: hypothetical protein ACFFG0_29980 [Candidatus Thorarchaeota archaeon]
MFDPITEEILGLEESLKGKEDEFLPAIEEFKIELIYQGKIIFYAREFKQELT